MPENWTKDRLEQFIRDGVQESLQLDYKGADALGKSDGKKKEITKDVSAMANSAGGTLIYGVLEFQDAERRHLPEKFDPVDQSVYTKEWLEQVIGNIQPRIQNIVITPVPIGATNNDVVYIVSIPTSTTAHQATDKRYYRRYNFESVAMVDYEIRDIMNRRSSALIDLHFGLDLEDKTVRELNMMNVVTGTSRERTATLHIEASNKGMVYAQHVIAYIKMPIALIGQNVYDVDENRNVRVRVRNVKESFIGSRNIQTLYIPILPGTEEGLETIQLHRGTAFNQNFEANIEWSVYADNAPVRTGIVSYSELRAGVGVRQTMEERSPITSPFH